jgi:hypothetical protein
VDGTVCRCAVAAAASRRQHASIPDRIRGRNDPPAQLHRDASRS